MKITGRSIGDGIYVIAEAGVNHNGDLSVGKRLIDAAAAAGADAVKFQTFNADQLVSLDAPLAAYQKSGSASARSQHELLKGLELTAEDHLVLKKHAEGRNLDFISTPFDEQSADFLAGLGISAIKISSGDLTNHLLLEHVARLRVPVVLSTGMASLGEIERAMLLFHRCEFEDIALLHCVSAYPASDSDANLRAIPALRRCFGVPVGWSDHTLGSVTAVVAVALGADIVEKHITLDRTMPGPDHKASLEPDQLADYVSNIRAAHQALGDGVKRPVDSEKDVAKVARRSLAAACNIGKGEQIERRMICALRPGTGLPPYLYECVMGKVAARDILRHELLDMGMLL